MQGVNRKAKIGNREEIENKALEKLTSKTKPFLSDLRVSCVSSKATNGAIDAVQDNSYAGKSLRIVFCSCFKPFVAIYLLGDVFLRSSQLSICRSYQFLEIQWLALIETCGGNIPPEQS